MAFTGRPNVTDKERRRMEGYMDDYSPKHMMLLAIEKILKAPDTKKAQEFDHNPMPAPKRDTPFDRWQKKNRGIKS